MAFVTNIRYGQKLYVYIPTYKWVCVIEVVLFLELKPAIEAIFGAKCPRKEKNALTTETLTL